MARPTLDRQSQENQPTRSRSLTKKVQKRPNPTDTQEPQGTITVAAENTRPKRTIVRSRRALEALDPSTQMTNDIMATLLRDPSIDKYDIIAIQEPWRNPFSVTTHHPAKDRFHLCYPSGEERGPARVCFFINKKIDHSQWQFRESSRDLCAISMGPGEGAHRIVKWARNRQNQPTTVTPETQKPNKPQIATTPEEKAALFKETIFPPPPEANLEDNNATYSNQIALLAISESEMEDAIREAAPLKAPGPDGITNLALRMARKWITPHFDIRSLGKGMIASPLLLDVSGAFDNASHRRLLHNLRKRRIDEATVRWIASFFGCRETEINVEGFRSETYRINTGIPQRAPLLPMLYLLYNADLLDSCNEAGDSTATGFIDDIAIVAVGNRTEETCQKLQEALLKAEMWSLAQASIFAPKKFQLTHFTRAKTRFDSDTTLQSPWGKIEPKTTCEYLGLIMDSSLKWKQRIDGTESKATNTITALSGIDGQVGAAAVIVLTLEMTQADKQNGNHRRIVFIHTDNQAAVRSSAKPKGNTVHTSLRSSQARHNHSGNKDSKSSSDGCPLTSASRATADVAAKEATGWRQNGQPGTRADKPRALFKLRSTIETWSHEQYHQRWQTTLEDETRGRTSFRLTPKPTKKVIQIHEGLSKRQSALLVQTGTEKIGLQDFLFSRRVPGITNANCPCREGRQTVSRILLRRRRYRQLRRQEFGTLPGRHNLRVILNKRKVATKAIRLIEQSEILGQHRIESKPRQS
ncbi:zinc knuckle [Colletotrichum orchidophilum]|uniref:Zinc knuckle n=1 Tax=Colletotrichum orchidophilum TaxID=1209926 RepID=A0A1G4AMD9_9PEZI|nr:zinc knuckle [Colletotrichum orchidophilum]OHE90327.1 zinc knuckle [Colletotrichum orchidophilum]